MGTRSLTHVQDEDGRILVSIYQQYDGYFDGVGQEILDFIQGSKIVNGISGGADNETEFNGAGDLAARLITMFKGGDPNYAGGVYVVPADADLIAVEFVYIIKCAVGEEPYLIARDDMEDYVVSDVASHFKFPEQDAEGNYLTDEYDDAPIGKADRAALFAMFHAAFDTSERDERIRFTKAVLGDDAPDSWKDGGGLTVGQSKRMLKVLRFINGSD